MARGIHLRWEQLLYLVPYLLFKVLSSLRPALSANVRFRSRSRQSLLYIHLETVSGNSLGKLKLDY
jgi:hypothetical protein